MVDLASGHVVLGRLLAINSLALASLEGGTFLADPVTPKNDAERKRGKEREGKGEGERKREREKASGRGRERWGPRDSTSKENSRESSHKYRSTRVRMKNLPTIFV